MPSPSKTLNATVIVSALGYFVDIYDLLLFSIVRVASLRSLGVREADLLPEGIRLINIQMIGMLFGGVLFGVLGDRRGRLSVLYGSIFLYSAANIANAFITTTGAYEWLRFFAGVGLAGELGAAITLISEVMSVETRGYGTGIVASVGILGAVAAALVGRLCSWQHAYLIGGILGLLLLFLRTTVLESGLFHSAVKQTPRRGDLRMILLEPRRLICYLCCVAVGIPTWFVVGVLFTFSPEFGRELGIQGEVSAGNAVLFGYLGAALGDLSAGFASQRLKSRRKVIGACLAATLVAVVVFLNARSQPVTVFYLLCAGLGLASGYWVVLLTSAAEHFGTNLRATVATSVPNFVRASVVPLTLGFRALQPSMGLLTSAMTIGVLSVGIAAVSMLGLRETYACDLDFLEE